MYQVVVERCEKRALDIFLHVIDIWKSKVKFSSSQTPKYFKSRIRTSFIGDSLNGVNKSFILDSIIIVVIKHEFNVSCT